MADLTTFVRDVQRLVQDREELRYEDRDIVDVLNMALSEARRLRPDLVDLYDAPQVEVTDQSFVLPAFLYMPVATFVAGWLEFGNAPSSGAVDPKFAALLDRLTANLVGVS